MKWYHINYGKILQWEKFRDFCTNHESFSRTYYNQPVRLYAFTLYSSNTTYICKNILYQQKDLNNTIYRILIVLLIVVIDNTTGATVQMIVCPKIFGTFIYLHTSVLQINASKYWFSHLPASYYSV